MREGWLVEGFVLLHRRILEWEWYDDINVFRLFVHCLLRANHADKEWRGTLVRRGTFISTWGKLSQETGLTVKQVRTAMAKLERTNEMAHAGTRQHTVFIIKNYNEYQAKGKPEGKQKANEGQTEGKQRATNNNDNNDNNENNKSRATRLSEFPLPEAWGQAAKKYWAKQGRLDLSPQTEFQKFQDNHIAKGGTSLDWSRNWRTWYSNAVQFSKPANQSAVSHKPNRNPLPKAGSET